MKDSHVNKTTYNECLTKIRTDNERDNVQASSTELCGKILILRPTQQKNLGDDLAEFFFVGRERIAQISSEMF